MVAARARLLLTKGLYVVIWFEMHLQEYRHQQLMDRLYGEKKPRPISLHSKEDVMAAYRALVQAQGGKVVGENYFQAQTRISMYCWRGKFWKSWREFQRAAGFRPNRRPERIPEETLLGRYAQLALEMKKLPTRLEMKLRRREDKTLPHPDVYSRLGRRETFLTKLEAWCEGKSEFAPVSRMLERRRRKLMARRAGDAGQLKGVVYLARPTDAFIYRIGSIKAFGVRARHEARRLSRMPQVVHVIQTDDPEGIERYWQGRYEHRRERDGFYCLKPDDIAPFRLRKFQ